MTKNYSPDDNNNPKKIIGRNIILCEGLDAKLFILHFLGTTKYVDLVDLKDDGVREIEIRNFGGNSQLTTHLMTLKSLDGFEKVKSILIIRDAESNYESAISEIKSALKSNGFPAPNSVCKKVKDENGIAIIFCYFLLVQVN